jgi:Glycosyltransferases involved in cell wall biogenesis
MPPVIALVIPVYNHREGLRDVVQRALNQCRTVIVVDDGSTDGSADSLEGLPITLARLPRNGGKGAAPLSGAAEAARLGATHMITLDADGQHYPEDIPLFLKAIAQHPGAIIVGCRDFNVPHVPGSSRFWEGVFRLLDAGADRGAGARHAERLPRLSLARAGLPEIHGARATPFEIEVLVRAAWAGFDVREIDIRVYYPPREERISHFKALKDNVRISLLNTRLTIRALVPVPFRQHSVDGQGSISLLRPMDSLRRLLADRATPWQLGRSAAVAIAVSTLPLPGLQSILLLLCVGWLRLNRLCALAMIPLTWPPFVPGLGVLLGYRLRKGSWLTEFSVQTLGYEAPQRILDWFAGALVLAPLLGLLAGAIVGALAYLAARGMVSIPQGAGKGSGLAD